MKLAVLRNRRDRSACESMIHGQRILPEQSRASTRPPKNARRVARHGQRRTDWLAIGALDVQAPQSIILMDNGWLNPWP